jgi:hypothetical protein
MGSDTVNIMQGNTPEVLTGLSAPARFLYSLFAESHSGYGPIPGLKLPFLLSSGEIRMAGGVDVRIAGFGPLFSGAIVLSALAALVLVARYRSTPAVRWALLGALALLGSVLLLPENWWSRYVPQLWYIPLIVALAAVLARASLPRYLGLATLAVLLVNGGLVAASSTLLTVKRSLAVDAQIAELKQHPGPYCIVPELAQSRLTVFAEHGLTVRQQAASDASNCAQPMEIAAYGPDRQGGRICPCAGK